MSKWSFLLLALTFSFVAGAAASDNYKLFSFCTGTLNCTDGAFPYASVTVGPDGTAYGTTYAGGNINCGFGGCGAVFRFGQSGEQVIYAFGETPADGVYPLAPLVFDKSGNIYGTTKFGGNAACVSGCGTVFELTPDGNGQWSEQILYSFCTSSNCPDGAYPQGALTFDAAGNIYGTTSTGGDLDPKQCAPSGCGTVFELVKGSDGSWTEKVLFQFDFATGGFPEGSLAFDASGNLYGASNQGGTAGYGVVFQLSPAANGFWKEKNILNFNVKNGRAPFQGVIIDKRGNLYGTTFFGGASAYCYTQTQLGCGEVFELSPAQNGTWKETILYSFCQSGNCPDGSAPWSGLVMDKSGALYGTTNAGGLLLGVVFKLTPTSSGSWTETVIHTFGTATNDGANPQAGVVFNSTQTALYGTTAAGGSSHNCNNGQSCGTVFELSK